MNRPWLLRVSPARARTALYYRFYRARRDKFKELYGNTSLHFAPRVRMDLLPTDEGHSNIAFTGLYEFELSERIVRHARHGGLMIDAGANYGYFSLLWAAASPRNRVMAFEAAPGNQLALSRNVALNGFESQSEIRTVALGRETGTLPFAPTTRGQTGWGGFSRATTGTTVETTVLPLDDCVSPSDEIELLKIDVEGADTWVLLGARRLLENKRIKHVYFEHNKKCMSLLGIPESEALDFLRTIGYAVEPLNDPASEIVEYHAAPAADKKSQS